MRVRERERARARTLIAVKANIHMYVYTHTHIILGNQGESSCNDRHRVRDCSFARYDIPPVCVFVCGCVRLCACARVYTDIHLHDGSAEISQVFIPNVTHPPIYVG